MKYIDVVILTKDSMPTIKSTIESLLSSDIPINKIIFVDGLRSMDEVKIFRKYWDFPIIAIICDKEVRYKRMTLRGRADDTDNLKKLIERDERELSFGVGDVIANADYKINNDSDIESLMKNTRDIVLKILDKKNS